MNIPTAAVSRQRVTAAIIRKHTKITELICEKLNEAAERGEFQITIKEDIHSHIVEKLKDKGYGVRGTMNNGQLVTIITF